MRAAASTKGRAARVELQHVRSPRLPRNGASIDDARPAIRSRLPEARFELPLRLGPLRVDDAEVDGVADVAVGHDHVAAEHAFAHAADPLDRGLRAEVAAVGLELHAQG